MYGDKEVFDVEEGSQTLQNLEGKTIGILGYEEGYSEMYSRDNITLEIMVEETGLPSQLSTGSKVIKDQVEKHFQTHPGSVLRATPLKRISKDGNSYWMLATPDSTPTETNPTIPEDDYPF